MVETDIQVTAADLYDYVLMHTYHGTSGIIGSTAGALFVVAGFLAQKWLLVIAGLVILLYLPITLHAKSKLQWSANEAFQKPLHYVLDENGVTVSQGEVSESQSWDSMVKAVSTPRSIILYTSGRNASIFPKAQLGDQKDALIEVISTHMPPQKVKIRS
ncbi:MAG: YcxB family protein [Lachnospiraceae bacterium]|nr:YcxB family protein [Lachnospiraceae bacterium]